MKMSRLRRTVVLVEYVLAGFYAGSALTEAAKGRLLWALVLAIMAALCLHWARRDSKP